VIKIWKDEVDIFWQSYVTFIFTYLMLLDIPCSWGGLLAWRWRLVIPSITRGSPERVYLPRTVGPLVPLSLKLLLLLCYFHNILNISILEPFTTVFIKHFSRSPWFTKYFPQNKFHLKYFRIVLNLNLHIKLSIK